MRDWLVRHLEDGLVIKVRGSQERAMETTKGAYTVSLLLTEITHTHVLPYTCINPNTPSGYVSACKNTCIYTHTHKHILPYISADTHTY